MSTELKAPTKTITATRFSGHKGTSIQLTKPRLTPSTSVASTMFNTLQLSRGEALLVAQTLLAFGLGNEESA